jgi:hypothetical protein
LRDTKIRVKTTVDALAKIRKEHLTENKKQINRKVNKMKKVLIAMTMVGVMVAMSVNAQSLGDLAVAEIVSELTVTNPVTTTVTNPVTSLLPGLPGVFGVILNNLVDDAPYVTNGKVSVDFAALFNSSNPKGTGHVGEYGQLTLPMSQQSAVGLGGGYVAGHSFITPVTLTVGTTLTNLPAAIGKVYSFVGDGVLYDFTGKQIGNWVCAGFYKNWTINNSVNLGLKVGTYNDSVVPGIGWFAAITGTF